MIHFLILLVCILSIEILIRLNFLSFIDSILKETRKVTNVISQDNISDHWKEKVIPVYALRIMKYSIQISFVLLVIISFFFIAAYFFNDFLNIVLSLIGVVESIFFAFGYFYLRKLYSK
tara:strand:+ start:182 stop:538 length:357 start_codon:yes stop_codon:yes gene_type:complete